MELWDLYDRERNPLNRLHKRGEPIPEGTYHLVVSILTLNSKKQILITLRNKNKHPYPGYWEITAGSAVAGENSRQGAVRELAEETGIIVSEDELIYLDTTYGVNGNGAIVDMYMVHRDVDIDDIKLQSGETEAAKWVSVDEFCEMIKRGIVAPPVVRRFNIVRKMGVLK